MHHFAATYNVTFDAGFQHTEFPPRRILQHTPLGHFPSAQRHYSLSLEEHTVLY